MGLVREFEEKTARSGRRSLVQDVQNYAEEIGMKLDLQNPEPIGYTKKDEVVGKQKIRKGTTKVVQSRRDEEIEQGKWQGKLMVNRWNEEDLHKDSVLLSLDVGMEDGLNAHGGRNPRIVPITLTH